MAVLNVLSYLDFTSRHVMILPLVIIPLYWITLSVKRLYLSPIAHIPGPKLAALTQYYEFYYDIILGGQYTSKIIELHKKYGPIIRISPWELHISDPEFFSELYTGPSRRREKWQFYTQQFGSPQSALATIDTDLHKVRRGALNPFFSTQSVRKLQPVIEERVDALLEYMLKYAKKSKEPIDLMYPYSAFTNDVICEYSFSRCDHLIEDPTWGKETTDNLLMGTHMGPMIKHMNWALTLINALPESISGRYIPGWGGFLQLKNDILNQITEIEKTANTDKWALDVSHPTIFHEMLTSKLLPPEEKTARRLAQEGQILVQGGTLTTSWTLALTTFHLLHRPSALRRLRDELVAAMPDADAPAPALADLENLPYLRGVVKEGLRLALGTSSRLARTAPDETLVFRNAESRATWAIPPGTAVGMSTYLTQTSAAVYADPRAFRPERWLGAAGDRLDRYLTVFGAGTRVCLGMALAHAELHLALAKVFRRWGGAGDHREGDIGAMRVYATTPRDCEMAADYFIPIPYKGSKGIRVVMEAL